MALVNCHILSLIIGFLLDKILGDPDRLPHPVVAFGRAISFFERQLNKGKHRLVKGATMTLFLVSLSFALFFVVAHFSYRISMVSGISVEAVFVFYGLAGTTLIKEGKSVFLALQNNLESGRKQVSRIVGRDAQSLNEEEIKAATLETLAENLSDGVIAPLFWLGIAGIPGMMAYKMVNTLDSMIGYKNEKYLHFGRFAAKLDDVANWIPARVTALLMAICSGKARAFRFIFKYGKAHSSPNAGYPEAALAGALDVTFGGAHLYFGKWVSKPEIGKTKRSINEHDLKITIRIIRKTELSFIALLVTVYSALTIYF